MTAPTGRPREMRNFPPAVPPRPFQSKRTKTYIKHSLINTNNDTERYITINLRMFEINSDEIVPRLDIFSADMSSREETRQKE